MLVLNNPNRTYIVTQLAPIFDVITRYLLFSHDYQHTLCSIYDGCQSCFMVYRTRGQKKHEVHIIYNHNSFPHIHPAVTFQSEAAAADDNLKKTKQKRDMKKANKQQFLCRYTEAGLTYSITLIKERFSCYLTTLFSSWCILTYSKVCSTYNNSSHSLLLQVACIVLLGDWLVFYSIFIRQILVDGWLLNRLIQQHPSGGVAQPFTSVLPQY